MSERWLNPQFLVGVSLMLIAAALMATAEGPVSAAITLLILGIALVARDRGS